VGRGKEEYKLCNSLSRSPVYEVGIPPKETLMATTASDVLIDTIHDWGVNVIFGLPGDGINGIMEALRKRQDKIRFVHVRHEEAAALMACAYAKYTGKLGCCLATSGPGGIHLLNGLYDAKLDGAPVLAITGLQAHDLVNTHTQQDVELDKLFMDVCVYNCRIMGANHVQNVAELACRTALSYHGVSHITMPVDFQELAMDDKQRSTRNVPDHVSDVRARSARLPNEHDLRKAAEILNAGTQIAILAGQGALDATDELEHIAEKLGAPVIKALLGKAAVPDDSPYTTGSIGLLGTKPSEEALEECDTLLIVGSSFPYIEFYPKPGQARAVQIELDPARIGNRYPVEVGLVGDSKRTLQELLPLLERNANRKFLEEAQAGMRDWRKLMEKRGTASVKPMKPQVVAWELGKRLGGNAIVSCDSGTITTWFARQIQAKRGQLYSVSGNLATMACGLPYAIAAQVAYPERQSIAFVGDGGFTMLMGEFATAVQYKLPIKVIIIKNNVLGQIMWEQLVFLGNPEYGCDLRPNIDFAAFARACGGAGFTIDDASECGAILDQALNTPGPVVVEAIVDPNEPPMPAKVTVQQAAKLAEALAKGTKDAHKIATTILGDKIRELV
jgi:pyruvate dehydrogenase (quinone)